MPELFHIVLVAATAFVTWLGSIVIERYASRMGLVTIPNSRSSHTIPTARGGGVSIACAIVLAGTVLAVSGMGELWPPICFTLCAAMLGFADDLLDLSPAIRFSVHAAIFATMVIFAAPIKPIELSAGLEIAGWLLPAVLVIAGIWWINLFNFMDGIDGLAASHIIAVLFGGLALILFKGGLWQTSGIFWLSVITVAATGGFLVRNWPPARIFMGDAGSNALAVVLFSIALATISHGTIDYQSWIILTATFIVDASVTLVRRCINGERPWRAHRRHAYQQLSRLLGHRAVTLLYTATTVFWSIPIAVAAQFNPEWSWQLVALTYTPLIGIALWSNAGATIEISNSKLD